MLLRYHSICFFCFRRLEFGDIFGDIHFIYLRPGFPWHTVAPIPRPRFERLVVIIKGQSQPCTGKYIFIRKVSCTSQLEVIMQTVIHFPFCFVHRKNFGILVVSHRPSENRRIGYNLVPLHRIRKLPVPLLPYTSHSQWGNATLTAIRPIFIYFETISKLVEAAEYLLSRPIRLSECRLYGNGYGCHRYAEQYIDFILHDTNNAYLL